MRNKRAGKHLIGLGIFILTLSLLAPGTALAVKQLAMGTSSVGGVFYNLGSPVAQCVNKALPEVNVTAEFTEGSTENLRLIGQKKMQLAVISPMVGYFARKGIRMFKGKPVDFRVVVRLKPNGNIWTVLKKNKDIKTIRDIKGHKVGVGTGGIGVMSRMQLAFFRYRLQERYQALLFRDRRAGHPAQGWKSGCLLPDRRAGKNGDGHPSH